MKKSNEEILRYLSGLMDPEEESKFLNKLDTDSMLKKEYDKINNTLLEYRSAVNSELNEVYFNNLVSKVREKLPAVKRRRILKEYALITPAIILVLFVSYLTLTDVKSDIDSASSIAVEVVKNLDDDELANNLIKDYSFESLLSYQTSGNDLDVYIPENLNLSVNNISHYVDFAKLDYTQIDNISGSDLENLYKNLSTINFQKVSK